ncbi:flagellar hook-basal body complex protein FliE [Paraburkholderia sediminicola]|uniref:flagellar hook-basal body complex protein FliE n=1 Tax=Paraburkholderia sediminicola TaxID=458836 RepID=UPI0038B7F44C
MPSIKPRSQTDEHHKSDLQSIATDRVHESPSRERAAPRRSHSGCLRRVHSGVWQLAKRSLEKISTAQASVGQEYRAFELGALNVSLNDVIIDGAKANIAFKESLEIRNRMVSAYTTIMQMPL